MSLKNTYIFKKLAFIDANHVELSPVLFDFLELLACYGCSQLPIFKKRKVNFKKWGKFDANFIFDLPKQNSDTY